MEHQEHLGAPLAEAADGDDLLDHRLVIELGEPIELELAALHVPSEILQVLDLAARQADAAQIGLGHSDDVVGAGHAAAEEVEQPLVDRARRLRRKLLAHNRANQCAEGVGGANCLAPPLALGNVQRADALDQTPENRVGGRELPPCLRRACHSRSVLTAPAFLRRTI